MASSKLICGLQNLELYHGKSCQSIVFKKLKSMTLTRLPNEHLSKNLFSSLINEKINDMMIKLFSKNILKNSIYKVFL
jgi:hypothetical protein